jgi:hypothetical protein
VNLTQTTLITLESTILSRRLIGTHCTLSSLLTKEQHTYMVIGNTHDDPKVDAHDLLHVIQNEYKSCDVPFRIGDRTYTGVEQQHQVAQILSFAAYQPSSSDSYRRTVVWHRRSGRVQAILYYIWRLGGCVISSRVGDSPFRNRLDQAKIDQNAMGASKENTERVLLVRDAIGRECICGCGSLKSMRKGRAT